MYKIKCLNCKKIIIKSGLEMTNKREYVKDGSFVKCQYCNAKNYIAAREPNKGPAKLYFHRFELD